MEDKRSRTARSTLIVVVDILNSIPSLDTGGESPGGRTEDKLNRHLLTKYDFDCRDGVVVMQRTWTFQQHSVIVAPASAVWRWVVTPRGINDEMAPWLTMSIPRGAEGITIDNLEIGRPIGRAWLRLFGLIPCEYDNLSIVYVEQGRRFREHSTMATMSQWIHDRTVEPGPGQSTRVTDVITFSPRRGLRLTGPVLRHVLIAFFRHRHRRLAARF